MNNKVVLPVLFLITIFFVILGKSNIDQIRESAVSYDLQMINKNKIMITSLTPQIRHLLISGNIREANRILINWRESGIFEEFQIIKNNEEDLKESAPSQLVVPIYFSEKGATWGKLKFNISNREFISFTNNVTSHLYKNSMLNLTLLFLLAVVLITIVWRTSLSLTTTLKAYLENRNVETTPLANLIWSPLLKSMKDITSLSNELHTNRLKIHSSETLTKISRQVSHDIRSPLSALNIALEDISSLPEKNRTLLRMSIQRIHDIANSLLKNTQKEEHSKLESTYIYPAIEEILSEKRLQYKTLSHISIQGEFINSKTIFAKINVTQLKQLLSNLINNSIEAIDKHKGEVNLSVTQMSNYFIIQIQDNGKGIPSEVLSRLGEENISYGKNTNTNSGFGLGVKHAVETIKSWGGTLHLTSQIGIGTTVTITLPLINPPTWFVDKIEFTKNQTILILDDDQEIHQVWMSLLDPSIVSIIHFYSINEACEWITNDSSNDFILLSDYEILGEVSTGLDLIFKHSIHNNSFLVTSHFEDISRKHANLRLIPKMSVQDIEIIYV